MVLKFLVALALGAGFTTQAFAGATGCPSHYLNGDAPEISNAKMTTQAREVCFSAFGVMHSGITRTPLWSAEHLTRVNLSDARRMRRVDTFHPEERLPAAERSELRDYQHSGMDRGHMSPSADQPNERAQEESFSLSNMIPQNPDNNRNLWEGIEAAVRTLAKQRGELYVITGPLFQGANLKQLNGRVMVPTHIFKVVYDPRQGEAAAYVVVNEATSNYTTMSVAELERSAGIDFFPRLPLAVKQTVLPLPAPTPHGQHVRPVAGLHLPTVMKSLRVVRALSR